MNRIANGETIAADLRWSLRVRGRLRRTLRRLRNRSSAVHSVERSRPITESVAARISLGVVVASYIAFFIHWTLTQHYGFATFGFDLGIFEQGMWLLSRFNDPFVTVLGLNLFGDHTSFILLLLVPFYWIFSSTSMLLVAQAVALGGAAIPLWFMAREKLRHEWLAFAVAVAYLAHPAVGLTNLENFHPDTFEVPLVFGALFFMVKQRWLGYGICVAALLLVKEDVPLMTFVLGIYVAIVYNRRVGIATSLVSAVWFAAILFLVFPAINGAGTMDAWRVPTAQFRGTGGLLETALLRPWEIVAFGLGPDKPWYLWQMMVPLAGMFLLAPGLALVAILPLLSNLLSTFWYQYQIEYHYGTLIVPVLVGAAVVGIARFREMRLRFILVGVMTASALISGYMWGPVGRASPRVLADPGSARAQAIRQAIDMIPRDADVSAAYFTVPHLAHREHIYEFPVPWQAQNWGDFSMEGERLPQTELIDYVLVEDVMEPRFQKIVDSLDDEGFSEIFSSEGIRLLHRSDE